MLLSASCSSVVIVASGLPRIISMMPPAISVANSGMTTTGIRPRAQLGTLMPGDPQRDEAGEDTADETADEPGAGEARRRRRR